MTKQIRHGLERLVCSQDAHGKGVTKGVGAAGTELDSGRLEELRDHVRNDAGADSHVRGSRAEEYVLDFTLGWSLTQILGKGLGVKTCKTARPPVGRRTNPIPASRPAAGS